MEGATNARCIGCGTQVVVGSLELGTLEDGRNCPSCVERMLESLPAALPSEAAHPTQWTLLHGSPSEEAGEREAVPAAQSIFALGDDDGPEPA
jgi:DNA-directed RNA polymerase subunit RPC12/RpoP